MLTFVVIIQLSEISPPHFRTTAITLFYVCWALGALFTTLIAFVFLNNLGWKVGIITDYDISTQPFDNPVSSCSRFGFTKTLQIFNNRRW